MVEGEGIRPDQQGKLKRFIENHNFSLNQHFIEIYGNEFDLLNTLVNNGVNRLFPHGTDIDSLKPDEKKKLLDLFERFGFIIKPEDSEPEPEPQEEQVGGYRRSNKKKKRNSSKVPKKRKRSKKKKKTKKKTRRKRRN